MAARTTQEDAKLTQIIAVIAPPELKELVGKAADRAGLSMSEYVVRLLARHFHRGDLKTIPRKKMGRPRKALNGGPHHGGDLLP